MPVRAYVRVRARFERLIRSLAVKSPGVARLLQLKGLREVFARLRNVFAPKCVVDLTCVYECVVDLTGSNHHAHMRGGWCANVFKMCTIVHKLR